ncbi:MULTISPECIES: non-ribosomal peptide synthetase, partial [unclassified Streptomyces]|uniref:non-ribosomal peptide synthetase n=1 Tax=unclassified Streptomyces TaxID=2593676 RepID=UPI00367F20CF
MIDHRGARNTIHDINHRINLTPHDRTLALSNLSFDLSVWDIFGTLTAGATLVLPNPGTQRDPHHWNTLIHHHHITIWNSVPALFELLTEHRHHTHDHTPTLRTALLSGDWIPLTLPPRAHTTFPHLTLHSLGGATEASIWSIHHPITTINPQWTSIPYGKPLTNQTLHILDHHQKPRPPYTTGHIHIGGTGTALGYWKDPHKTNNAFTTNPHTHQRLYRTGDLGRYWPDGTIEFLGREDQQTKINGYRIEPGEIDNTLTTHPHIHTTLTTTHTNPTTNTRQLTTYIIPTNPTTPPNPQDIRNWLHTKLPHYMIPTHIITLDKLPLTPNGKINHKALPHPTTQPHNTTHTPPTTPTEHTLTTIWTQLLNPPHPLSTTHNLFQLGADSLLALRATAQADQHGLHLTLPDIFNNPTINQQA